MRAAILARFSTDNQRDASCDDQIRVCTARAAREGWAVVATYRDHAVSGTVPVAKRAGGAQMLADAIAGRFEVLLLEGLDRLARDALEQEQVVRRLEFRGIRLIGVSDGYDSASKGKKLHRGMRGLINEIYLDDLREKVHRALDGLALRGMNAAGAPYGYTSVPDVDGRRLAVDPARAEHVRFIFARFAAGESLRAIADALNRARVPSPRGSTWAVSALYGSPKKGCGILNNPIYIGRYTWNRSQWVKDPETGKRRRLERPRAEWRELELPALRIVSDDAWRAARARIDGRRAGEPKRPPRSLLAGVLRCEYCGGAVVAVSQYSYGCAARKDRGTHVCPGVRVGRRDLEQGLLAFVRTEFLGPDVEQHLVRYAREDRQARNRDAGGATEAARTRLATLEREIAHLVDAVAACGFSAALRERLAAAEAERERLQATLADDAPALLPDVIPRQLERLRAVIATLPEALKRAPQEARELLKELLGNVTLRHEGNDVIAEGDYAGILAAIPGGQIRHLVAGVRYRNANRHTIKYAVRIRRQRAA